MAKANYPKLAFSRGMPESTQALMTKLVPDRVAAKTGQSNNDKHLNVSRDGFEKRSKAIAQDLTDASSVFQLLPDTELAEQILVGSILSPKDMSSVDLLFTLEEGGFDSEVARPMLAVIQEHFKQDYKIDDRLDAMLEEILFTKGAHILTILPENNLDMIINQRQRPSLESFEQAMGRLQENKPMGFLGHPREARVSLEGWRHDMEAVQRVEGTLDLKKKAFEISLEDLRVTDNFSVLKTPNLAKRRRTLRINKLLNKHQVSMESASKGLSADDIDQLYRVPRDGKQGIHSVIPQDYMDRPPVGHPLVMKLPPEAVIPVFPPGQPDEHVGYFVILDPHGRPVQKDTGRDYYGEIRSRFESTRQGGETSDLVRRTKEALNGVQADTQPELDVIEEAYGKLIENDLLNRLRNGLYGEEFSLGFTSEIHRLMLHRSLEAQQTQLLYIPAELMVYMAFDYNEFGVGQSLLTKSKILASMRSVLMFAETMAGVRNAVGRKKANLTIDGEDPDPMKTIADIQSAILESGQRGFPLGSPDPGQTLDYLNRAGFDFSINVESDNYPNTKVEYDDYTSNQQAGNPELQDRLRRLHISSMGLNPELVDPTQSPDFAVSVVNNNLMMTRRVLREQKKFTGFLTHFIRTYTQHSSLLLQRLSDVVSENKQRLSKEHKKLDPAQVVEEFLEGVSVTLPRPDTTKFDQQLQAFEQYTNLLDRALEAYITPDIFPAELLAKDPEMINHVISVIRAYYQRRWLDNNNVMPELDSLTEMEDKKPVFNLLDVQQGQIESLGGALQDYLDKFGKLREKWATRNAADPDAPLTPSDDNPVADLADAMGEDDWGDLSDTDGVEDDPSLTDEDDNPQPS